MSANAIAVRGIGWVLPAGTGSGAGILTTPDIAAVPAAGQGCLEGFSAKEYLNSVKGYLDPAASYVLAAAALATGTDRPGESSGLRERSGICTATRFGAPSSGYRFFEQFVNKGARFASPLVFPHGYSNTAGNLAAIEFEFGGPHMVFYGNRPLPELLAFTRDRLLNGEADDMLAIACEATVPEAVPDGLTVLNGAVALYCTRCEDTPDPLLAIGEEACEAGDTAAGDAGTVAALCALLAGLSRP